MSLMKAVRFCEFGEPDVLRYEDVEIPPLKANHVRVKVEAIGVNFADAMRRRNQYLEPTSLPHILSAEVAGTVVELGEGATQFQVGDRVVGLAAAGYSDYAQVPVTHAFSLPDGIGFDQATTLLVQGMTAFDIIADAGRLQEGESILVHAAAGGVGIFSVQLARLLGAKKIIATAGSAAKLAIAQSLGADVGINYNEAGWFEQVNLATAKQGVDVALEMVGGDNFLNNFKCLNVGGRVVVFGAASRDMPTLNPIQLMYKNHSVVGYWMVHSLAKREAFAQKLKQLMQWVASGQIKTVVEQTFMLADAAKAHRLLENRQTVGKVVLRPAH